MFKKLLEIIHSNEFRVQLAELNDNFFNLKQEIQIRNLLVELFNQKHKQENERAIAEYRVPNKDIRIDLALVSKNNQENAFKIELKYHFPKDKGGFSEYQESIQKHFEDRGSNGFILIVCDSDVNGRKKFESDWLNDKTMFSKLSLDDLEWKKNLEEKFKNTADSQAYFSEITVEKPFKTTYHFFILERRKVIFPLS
ncbi:hypothetical protein [Capnocytophaga granulosa]|uniref:hypothetical protein n=1 Tax=Capnocytophaga granulosa TaxID=45242 RepID=UPI0036213174